MSTPGEPRQVRWGDLERSKEALRRADPLLYEEMYDDDLEERVAGLDRITRDPEVRGGLPCIRGTRFPVWSVLDWLASGRTPEQLMAEFPFLQAEDVRQALKWAAERLRDDVVIPREGVAASEAPAAVATETA